VTIIAWKRGLTLKCPITYFEAGRNLPDLPKSTKYAIFTLPGLKQFSIDYDRLCDIDLKETCDASEKLLGNVRSGSLLDL